MASAIPEGFELVESVPQGFSVVPDEPKQEEAGFFDAVTGESKMTQAMQDIPEISRAPELGLGNLSMDSLKASIGMLTTGDTDSLKSILTTQFGDKVSFSQDEKGNVIVNFPSGPYALNKPGLSQEDIVRGVFDAAAFTPAGRGATLPIVAAKSGLTEAGLETIEQETGGADVSGGEIAGAATLGGLFKGLEGVLGAGYRAFSGDAVSPLVKTGEDVGIPLLTSDVIPPKTLPAKMAVQTGEKIPFAGTGGIRESQQVLREKQVSDVAERYGQFSYDTIISSLKEQKNRVKSAAGNVMEAVGRQLDDIGTIPMPKTSEAIESATEGLQKQGVIKSSTAMDDLQTLVDAMKETPQTFTTLKENRTAFKDIINGADKADRSQLTSRAKSLLMSVESAMKSDMTAHAKANLSAKEFAKWQRANSVYASEAQKLTKSRLKNVLDKGDVTPESVQTLLFSQKPSEVKSLYQSLTPSGRANARSAIISKVLTNLDKRAGGLTPNTFASEMRKQGLQVDTFFKGEEKKQLKGLLDVLESTKRAQDAGITTPTGQSLMGMGTGYAAFTDLTGTLGTLGTLGGLARLYESAPVRNALLRLGSTPKGSTQFEQALSEALEVMSTGAQVMRRESQDNQ